MSVLTVKILTGEEFVGEVTKPNNEETHWMIKNPAMIHVQAQPSGQAMMGLVPALPMSKDEGKVELKIHQSHVVFSYEPSEALVKAYQETFSTIVQAKHMPLMV